MTRNQQTALAAVILVLGFIAWEKSPWRQEAKREEAMIDAAVQTELAQIDRKRIDAMKADCPEKMPVYARKIRGNSGADVYVDVTGWYDFEFETKEALAAWASLCNLDGAEIRLLDSRTRRQLARYSPKLGLRLD